MKVETGGQRAPLALPRENANTAITRDRHFPLTSDAELALPASCLVRLELTGAEVLLEALRATKPRAIAMGQKPTLVPHV